MMNATLKDRKKYFDLVSLAVIVEWDQKIFR